MKVTMIIALLLGLAFGNFNICFAQKDVAYTSSPASIHDGAGTAKVPVAIAIQGRQEVTKYLGSKIDHLLFRICGRNVATIASQNTFYVSRENLVSDGFDGSFASLEDAIGRNTFFTEFFDANSWGWRDIYIDLSVRDDQNDEIFLGNGNLVEIEEPKQGILYGYFSLYYWIPYYIEVEAGEDLSGVMLISGKPNYQSSELELVADPVSFRQHSFMVRSAALESGYLAITTNAKGGGETIVIDLTGGYRLPVKQMLVFLTQIQSGDVSVVRDPGNDFDWTFGRRFYKTYGYVFGRYPLVEIVTGKKGYADTFSPNMPIWGGGEVLPISITVTEVGSGQLVPVSRLSNGLWGMKLAPFKKYQMEVDFGDTVTDPEMDPWGRG